MIVIPGTWRDRAIEALPGNPPNRSRGAKLAVTLETMMRWLYLLMPFSLVGCPNPCLPPDPVFAPSPDREDTLRTSIPDDLMTSCNDAAWNNPLMADFCDSTRTLRAVWVEAERGNPLVGEVAARQYAVGGGSLILFVDEPRRDAPRLTSAYLVPDGAQWEPDHRVEAEVFVEEVAGDPVRIAARVQDGNAELVVVSGAYMEPQCAF